MDAYIVDGSLPSFVSKGSFSWCLESWGTGPQSLKCALYLPLPPSHHTLVHLETSSIDDSSGVTHDSSSKVVISTIINPHNTSQVSSRDAVQDSPYSSAPCKASSPSTPTHHPATVAYKQTRLHRTKPAGRSQRTTRCLREVSIRPQRLYPLRYRDRPCL